MVIGRVGRVGRVKMSLMGWLSFFKTERNILNQTLQPSQPSLATDNLKKYITYHIITSKEHEAFTSYDKGGLHREG
jgi:hypothetical protein